MKANSSFPHPVLGVNKGVLPDLDSQALELVSCNETDHDYVYTFQLKQENAQISRYISENKAEYICEVDCVKTLYKKITPSPSPTIEVKMKKTEVTGHVDFSFYVVTKFGMPNYKNNQFNPDYKDTETGALPSFNLEKGSVLVLFPCWSDNVNLRFNNTPELKSFIQVSCRQDDINEVEIILDSPIIFIQLPEKMFADFQEYNTKDNRGLFYSSMILNALIKGIVNIGKSDYENYLWADSIKAIVENSPEKYKSLSLEDPSDAVDIAFNMLSSAKYGNPYDLLFSSIKKIEEL